MGRRVFSFPILWIQKFGELFSTPLFADRQTLCCFQICDDIMLLFGAVPAIYILWSSQKASLLDIVDHACGICTPREVRLAYLSLITSFQLFSVWI
jgi:hypothetical protein